MRAVWAVLGVASIFAALAAGWMHAAFARDASVLRTTLASIAYAAIVWLVIALRSGAFVRVRFHVEAWSMLRASRRSQATASSPARR